MDVSGIEKVGRVTIEIMKKITIDVVSFVLRLLKKRRFGRLSYLSSGEGSKDDAAHFARGAFTKIASYKGSLVAVKILKKRHVEVRK